MKTKIERATKIHRTMTPHQMALRIVELQDALELADEAVRATYLEIPEDWQLVPAEPTPKMRMAGVAAQSEKLKRYALGGSLPPIDHGIPDAYRAMLAAAPKHEGGAS